MGSECMEHQKRIAAYCLGELSGPEKQALEVHLLSCSSCRSEKESHEHTIGYLRSVEDEAVPRHFFIYPEQIAVSTPWQLLRSLSMGWKAAVACAAGLMLFIGLAAASRLQIRSDSTGWAVSFGKADLDTATLKKEILNATDQRNREAAMIWSAEMRSELSQKWDSLSKQQQIQFLATLAKINSQLTDQIRNSEGNLNKNTRDLVSNLYYAVSQQRAKDLEAINLRFDSTDANSAIKARQTNEILGTLLQVADFKLR